MLKIIKNDGHNEHVTGKYIFCTDDFDVPDHEFYADIRLKPFIHWLRYKTSKKYRNWCKSQY